MNLIGDPHLGRVFKHNVPLDRRGEREIMLMDDFRRKLWDCKDELVVVVGDLFEHWHVSHAVIWETIVTIQHWASIHPTQTLAILQGNHDYSPEEGVYGAFDILDVAMTAIHNVRIVRAPETLLGVCLFPWQWNRTAEEQLDDITVWTDIAVGHWDLESFGDSDAHLCPAESLREKGVSHIYSGHWHIAGDYRVGSVLVKCTGSMQPMTFAEDPEGKLYVTLTAQEYLDTDPQDLQDKYVRVLVAPGEDVSPPPTCLGFKVKREGEVEAQEERVSLGNFEFDKILDTQFQKHDVREDLQKDIKGQLRDLA